MMKKVKKPDPTADDRVKGAPAHGGRCLCLYCRAQRAEKNPKKDG